jgi:hypothetical protein
MCRYYRRIQHPCYAIINANCGKKLHKPAGRMMPTRQETPPIDYVAITEIDAEALGPAARNL